MKIALCFIISYNHILNKESLWIDWIESNKDIINVYIHYKDKTQIKSKWILNHIIPQSCIQPTTYYDVVPAYMSLMSYAYYHDSENQWFCLLTDSCVPIISPEIFRKLFLCYKQSSIIHCKPAYWNIEIHKRANLRYLKPKYHLANDPWFTLTRKHVNESILFFTCKNNLYRKINSGGLANESIFGIILETFNELTNEKHIINSSATICDWSRMSNPTSPFLFCEDSDENNNIIINLLKENPYAMFLRKVSPIYPDVSIKKFWNIERKDKDFIVLKNNELTNKRNKIIFQLFFFIGVVYCTRFIAKFIMNSYFV
jgi:hypothetical protein